MLEDDRDGQRRPTQMTKTIFFVLFLSLSICILGKISWQTERMKSDQRRKHLFMSDIATYLRTGCSQRKFQTMPEYTLEEVGEFKRNP